MTSGTGSGPWLRQGARAVILDDRDRVLLVRFEFTRPMHGVAGLWAAPGGGVEDGEDDRRALTRELAEEVGLDDPVIGPLIWTRTHVLPMSTGHDGQREGFYLVRTPSFEPRPALSAAALRAENVVGLRWWTVDELAASDAVFAPRRLPGLVAALVADGLPDGVINVGV
ncbi:MAG TPA: NUDIX domain-containing protein [Acidimicrobiales bacterium]|jgi:8-oxo-dGTP pyrophosphatase MutT (NUDIX family)|nr:NUDIX domain-containing protein [Acidimicrobiales bacterium]